MDMFDLGNFPLTAGFTIPNARLAYTTHGTLSAAKDNAILFPNFLGGSDQALELYIGNDLALDPRKYFIVLPGQFGNGFSSSPSNTPPPFDRGAFPPIHVADDVIAQHRLLTEHFGITELRLVLGWSIGAMQTYEWAVRFPQMVKRMVSIAGAPRPSPWTHLWLRTVFFMGEEVGDWQPYRYNDFIDFREDYPGLRAGAGASLVPLLPGSHPPAACPPGAAVARNRHPACARREPRAGVPAMGGRAGYFGDGEPQQS